MARRICISLVASAALAALLGGCVGTAVGVATLPFKAVGAGVDAVTTSQAEADRKRGKAIRKQEEREAKERRREEKAARESGD